MRRMKKVMLLLAVAMLAIAHRSDGQQPRSLAEQLKLAAVMPRGAMVYLQASDLSALMKTWLASPVRSQFYNSASFAAFQTSHVYLKIQDRLKEFETAIGVGIDEKRLAGAGLDVTDPEPLPPGHPLWKFENVVITPHVATVSDGIAGRMRELTLDNVARFAKGQPLRNVVDKQKGY